MTRSSAPRRGPSPRFHRPLLLVAAAAATLLATLVLAQQDRDGGYDRFQDMPMRDGDVAGGGWSANDRREWRSGNARRDRWSDRRSRDDDEDDGDARGGRRDGRSYGMGASFLLRSGNMRRAVRCGAQETMRACVEAATTLLHRARSAAEPRQGSATLPATAP